MFFKKQICKFTCFLFVCFIFFLERIFIKEWKEVKTYATPSRKGQRKTKMNNVTDAGVPHLALLFPQCQISFIITFLHQLQGQLFINLWQLLSHTKTTRTTHQSQNCKQTVDMQIRTTYFEYFFGLNIDWFSCEDKGSSLDKTTCCVSPACYIIRRVTPYLDLHSLRPGLLNLLADLVFAILLVRERVCHALHLWPRKDGMTIDTKLTHYSTPKRAEFTHAPYDRAWCPWNSRACRLSAGTNRRGEIDLIEIKNKQRKHTDTLNKTVCLTSGAQYCSLRPFGTTWRPLDTAN